MDYRVVFAASAIVLTLCRASAQSDRKEDSPSQKIAFEVTRTRPARFDHPTEIQSSDRRVILRVEKGGHFVRLYDAATKRPIGPQIVSDDGIALTALAIAADNKTVAVGSTYSDGGGGAKVWDASTGKKVAEWESGGVISLKFSDDGKSLSVRCGPAPKS